MTKKLYAKRNPIEQGQYYMDHLMAMTAEDLHSKSAIAEELAHRDIVIEELLIAFLPILESMEDVISDGDDFHILHRKKDMVDAACKTLNKYGLSDHKPSWHKTDTTK